MNRHDAGTTNPVLLERLGDWSDHEAWIDFVRRYEPVIRASCRRYRLGEEGADELCQRVWIDLARRMRTFRYDPGRTFRGWLLRLCQSRAIDVIREARADATASLEDWLAASPGLEAADDDGPDDGGATERPRLLRLAEGVQDGVRRRVEERTWRVFWDVAVEGRSVGEAAEAAGMSYFAAFAAQRRVGQMLREAGRRLMADGPRADEAGTD